MINDQMGARQTLLKEGLVQSTHVDRTMHSRGEANLLMQQMDVQKPDLLWIRLAGYAIGSGNKVDRKRANTLVDLANKQLNDGRKLLIEADVHCGAWTLIEYQELCKRLTTTKHAWCNYGIKTSKGHMCSITTQFASSFPLAECGQCRCGEPVYRHKPKPMNCAERHTAMRTMLSNSVLASLGIKTLTPTQAASHAQPESLNKSIMKSLNHTKSNTESSRVAPRGQERNQTSKPTDNGLISTTESETNLPERHSQSALLSELLKEVRKTVTFGNFSVEAANEGRTEDSAVCGGSSSSLTAAFPTEQAIRQKESLKAKKEAGGEIKKKKQIVEAHADDCGMDLSGIEADIAGLEMPSDDFGSMSYWASGGSSSSTAGDPARLARWLSSKHWLFGSSAQGTVPFDDKAIACDGIETFLAQARKRTFTGQVDVMEMFGGAADTSRLLVRRYNAVTGINFDLTCGFNLRNQKHVQLLIQYVDEFKPVVVVMAPPCTGLKGWAGVNRVVNPEGHARSVENSTALGKLAAAIAARQLNAGRHFVAENPRGSQLWQLPEWQHLLPRVARCTFDQCRTGLRRRKPPLLPVMKPTEMWASHPALIRRLANKYCKRDHQHAVIGNDTWRGVTVDSKETQVWPHQLCRLIAAGIQELLELHYRGEAYVSAVSGGNSQAFPVRASEGTRIRESDRRTEPLPQAMPEGVSESGCRIKRSCATRTRGSSTRNRQIC